MIEIFYLDNEIKKADIKDVDKIKDKPVWVDVNDITNEEMELLKDKFSLHPLTAEDLFNQNIRVKVEDFPNYIFCVFYGMKKGKTIKLFEMDYILGKNFLITNHKEVIESFENLKKDDERLIRNFNKGLEFLFHKLLDMEIDNFFPVLESFDEKIERLEEEAIRKPNSKLLSEILKTKRFVVQVKKVSIPQREKIGFLAKNESAFISKKSIPYFRDIYDHMIRVADIIDNYREDIGNAFDVYMSTISNNMNEVMKVLSIIATIALPLTVISGIYGTNFSNLPGSGMMYGFWIMILFMILMVLGMLYFFRKREWF